MIFAGVHIVSGTEQIPMGAIIAIKLDLQRSGDKDEGGDGVLFALSREDQPW